MGKKASGGEGKKGRGSKEGRREWEGKVEKGREWKKKGK